MIGAVRANHQKILCPFIVYGLVLWIGLGYSSVCTRMNGNALKDSGSGSLTARIRLRRLKRTTEQLVRSILRGTIDYLS